MSESSLSHVQAMRETHTRLKTNALNFWEVLAQAVALISPSMTAALIVPLMFGTAGTAGWLCYLFGTIMLLFVAFSLNQFSKRYTSAGSMYEYTVKGLGPKTGGLSGWCLIWAYMFIGIAGVTGFTHFATKLLGLTSVNGYLSHPSITLFAICVLAAWFLAYNSIQFSTILMLVFEGISVALILMLAFLTLAKTGVVDHAQWHPAAGHGLKDIGLGVVVAIFSLVGFECATAFGEEAKTPLKTIPRAVIASLLLTGTFFVFITYVETHALAGNTPPLDQLDAPLTTLSANLGVKWMGVLISIGAMVSFFALALSCMNAGSRVLFTMGRYGIFPTSVGSSHKKNLTPHVGISLFAAIQFLIPTTFILLSYVAFHGWQMAPFDAFNDAGLFGAMGFCGAYVLISLATPFYLKKIGELKIHHIAVAVISLALLLVPIVGTVWPVPAAPLNYFPYIFVAYLLCGVVLVSIRSRTHVEMDGIRKILEETTMAPSLGSAVMSRPSLGSAVMSRPSLGKGNWALFPATKEVLEMTASLGSLASLHRYPVKSMMGEALNSAQVTRQGLFGDRSYALCDTETGKVVSAKNPRKWPNLFSYQATYTTPPAAGSAVPPVRVTLPNGGYAVSSNPDFAPTLSGTLGRSVTLLATPPQHAELEEYWPDMEELSNRDVVTDEAMPQGTFFDLAILHVLTTGTLDRLRELNPRSRFEPRRFRPNLIIDTGEMKGFVENDWIGKEIAIGPEVRIQVTGPCPRCVMTTLSQADLPKDPGILKTAAQYNEARVGAYASVVQAGTIRIGDTLTIV